MKIFFTNAIILSTSFLYTVIKLTGKSPVILFLNMKLWNALNFWNCCNPPIKERQTLTFSFLHNFKLFPQWRSFCVFHSSICYSVYYSTKSNHFYAFQSGGLAVWRRISLVGLRVSNMANTLFSSSSSFGNGKRAAQRLRSFDDWLDWQHSYGCVVRCSKSLVDKSEVN